MKDSTKRLYDFLRKCMVEDGLTDQTVFDESEPIDRGLLHSSMRDAITDIMHICDKEGMSLQSVMDSAKDVFEEESSDLPTS